MHEVLFVHVFQYSLCVHLSIVCVSISIYFGYTFSVYFVYTFHYTLRAKCQSTLCLNFQHMFSGVARESVMPGPGKHSN